MKAIIKLNNGKYYISKIFGIYNDKLNDKQKAGYSFYYIIFNETGTELIKKYEYKQKSLFIIREILICDTNTSYMKLDENDCGKVSFISNEEIEKIKNNQRVSPNTLKQCLKYIDKNKIDYIKIKDENDIKNLMSVSFGFHDADIENLEEKNNKLYVLFSGIWGCKIQIIFEGNIQYKIETNNEYSGEWFGATMLLDNNQIILVDDENYKKDENLENYSNWFKADKIKYIVIPDK